MACLAGLATGESHFASPAWAALQGCKQKENEMEKLRYKIDITEPKTVGKTIAFVKVTMGPLWVTCRLDFSKGQYFLNPPATFVESLQGTPRKGGGTNTGWINNAGFDREFTDEVKGKALAELGLKEKAA